MRFFRRLFHLAEDLGLAQHHRIETGSDAESVVRGILLWQQIEIGLHIARWQAVEVSQPLRHAIRFLRIAVNLGAIAGGENGRFPREYCPPVPRPSHIRQGFRKDIGRESHPLTDGNRRGVVVNAAGEKLHFSNKSRR